MRKTLLAIAALAVFPWWLATTLWAQAPAGGCAEVPGQGMLCSAPFTFNGGLELPPAGLVSALPTCNAGARGQLRVVTDATAPAYNATIAGGGAVITMVLCNGTNWTAH